MANISTPAWPRSPTRWAEARMHSGSGMAVYSFNEGKIAPERLINLPLQQLPRAERQTDRRCRWRQRRALSGGDRGCRRGWLREASRCRQSLRRCSASRCRDRRNRKTLRPFRKRRGALHLSHRPRGHERRHARVCRVMELIGNRRTRSGKQLWAANWPCSNPRSQSPPGPIPAPSSFRPTARFSTSRSPTAMPSQP